MKKHMLCLVILCCLLLQLLVFPAAASTTPQSLTQPEDLKQKITYFYHASLEYAEKSSFDGYCAFYVNTQLYLLKINRKYVAGNGNQQWENYRYLKETNGGYEVHAYSSRNYTLAESLRAISETVQKTFGTSSFAFKREWALPGGSMDIPASSMPSLMAKSIFQTARL